MVVMKARWFAPESEIAVCGHASVIAARIYWSLIAQEPGPQEIQFQSEDGINRVRLQRGKVRDEVRLLLPVVQSLPMSLDCPENFHQLLGCPESVALQLYCSTVPKVLIVLPTQQDVERLVPKTEAIRASNYMGVVVTAPGQSCDYVLRYFCPKNGFAEDYVTASAHGFLAPYWSKRLGKHAMTARQLSQRPCVLSVKYQKATSFVRVTGRCCIEGKGSLYVPVE